jgi:LacI family transcriptional regulator
MTPKSSYSSFSSQNFRQQVPQVAVFLETSNELARAILRGIMQYVRMHGPWGLHIAGGGFDEQKLSDLRHWGATGIIARLSNENLAQMIIKAKLPTVLFLPQGVGDSFLSSPTFRCGTFRNDSAAIGNKAAEYFLEQQFEHLAFIGDIHAATWSLLREQAFVQHLRQAGYDTHVFPVDPSIQDWWRERRHVVQWLKTLQKPFAVFAANDNRGRQLLDACLVAGITVPYQAAVLGVDNDELVCESSQPTLSSIAIGSEQAGFRAAEMLDRMFHGGESEHLLYGPTKIVSRESTDLVHVSDVTVIRALEFIRINTGFQIRVSDVAKHVGTTPRWLEILFKRHLGFSVVDEIKRIRLKRVCVLLKESDLSFQEISELCGFENANYLSRIFRLKYGMTMTQFKENPVNSVDPVKIC